MKFLLDTDTCVFWLRGNQTVQSRLSTVEPEAVAVSVISLAELRYGANCSAKPAANHTTIDDFIGEITILGIDQEIVRAFADLKAQLRKEGLLIEDFDLLIAATARTFGLTLVTNNLAHFERIAGLALENWTFK